MPELTRYTTHGVTLLGDESRPCGVTLAFTERTGGLSKGEYGSLNLGDACGDDPETVAGNRRLLLEALGVPELEGSLVNPRQVHGDRVVTISSGDTAAVDAARSEARAGADAIVCTARRVPILLCFADCVPVILVAPGGFAVAHSGWRGTLARIAAKAARALAGECGVGTGDVRAYVGPHISGADYEVSGELLGRFEAEFGDVARHSERHLDLGAAVRAALEDVGVPSEGICDCGLSTASNVDRFFSYRAEGGRCGRHGAIALMADEDESVGK